MRARRWMPFLALTACNDADVVTSSGRCAELVDFLVRTETGPAPFVPIPANTAGDERLELWFYGSQNGSRALLGYEPGSDGTYVERWSWLWPENLVETQVDVTGDGYVDFIVAPDDASTPELYLHPAQPDGSVSAQPVTISLLAGESVRAWRDIDQDGRVDRISRVNDDYVWISGDSGEVHAFGVRLPEDDLLWRLDGDSRLWGMRGAEPDATVMGRVEDSGFRVIWEGHHGSLLRGSGLHGDHFDVIEERGEPEQASDRWLVLVDPSGAVLGEQLLAASVLGMVMLDYDGDGERDLVTGRGNDEHFISFGSAEHEYTEPRPFPAFTRDDQGVMQSFDLDRDGRTELLMAFEREEGQYQWSALGWSACDQVDDE